MAIVTIDPAIGLTKSETHDPFPPIEFGRRDELTSSSTIGNLTLSGVDPLTNVITNGSSVFLGMSVTFSTIPSGNAENISYTYSSSNSDDQIGGPNNEIITFVSSTGARTITVNAVSPDASDSPQSASIDITVTN